MQIVCKSLFTQGVQNVQHLHETCPETLSPLANCGVDNVPTVIGTKIKSALQMLDILYASVSK